MLLFRSISLEVFLLIFVHQLRAQDYEEHSEYNSEDDGESHGHPDYSKYYSVDGPAAGGGLLSGFVGASDFSNFFAPQAVEFAGSNKKPLTVPPINFIPQEQQQSQSLPIFSPIQQASNYQLNAPLKDYFEESQQKQLQKLQAKDDFIKPGPSYISHQLPLIGAATASADEVERIPPRPNKPKSKKESDEEIDEIYKDSEDVEKEIASDGDKYLRLLNNKPYVNYNTGKSSSTVSQYPLASGLLDVSSTKLTPYQKYSFQPIVQASRVVTDDFYVPKPTEPFNPSYQKKSQPILNLEGQPTENVPSHLKDHDCRKISDSSSADMNCFVCVNAETKSKYTQCSYQSEKEPQEYNQGYSERYSVPAKEGHFRYRRYTDRKSDPYYEIRGRALKANSEPSIPDDYSAGFRYEPESYDESSPEVSYSEEQSQQLKKNPQNCKKIDKDGATCTVCRDPKTGGNYEQCSYSSAPSEKKYAYVKEKKYNSDDDEPEESKSVTKTQQAPEAKIETTETKNEEKPVKKDFEPIEKHEDQVDQPKSPKKRNDDSDPLFFENYKKSRDASRARYAKEKYEIPTHFADSIVKETRNPNQHSDDEGSKDFDEYHFKLFPELSKEESRKEESREEEEEEYQIPESTKQNVEAVLEEFTKKDRSNCKKSEKNGMTCFLCVDKNKIQHEECMFVQESRPKSTHVAYHELKGIKKLENDEQPDESKTKPILTEREKSEFLNKDATPETLETAASEGVERRVAYKDNKDLYKKKRSPKKYKKKPGPEPTLKTPAEFEVGDEEGAYSADTKPAHSKLHGVQLPKYMVDKSEYEKEFDAFSGAL